MKTAILAILSAGLGVMVGLSLADRFRVVEQSTTSSRQGVVTASLRQRAARDSSGVAVFGNRTPATRLPHEGIPIRTERVGIPPATATQITAAPRSTKNAHQSRGEKLVSAEIDAMVARADDMVVADDALATAGFDSPPITERERQDDTRRILQGMLSGFSDGSTQDDPH